MKHKINYKLILFIVLFWSIGCFFAIVSANNPSEVKEGKIIINEPTDNGSFFISTNISENISTSDVIKANFPFNNLYIQWQAPDSLVLNQDYEIAVRFLNESWSNWQKVQFDDDNQGKDNSRAVLGSQLMTTKLTDSFQYKISWNNSEAKTNLKNLQFIYLDTSKGPRATYHISSQTNSDDLKIISRAEWGANENYRYDATNIDLWPEEYYTPKKFVIHHTAGDKANDDPKASIRAIQYYHAVTRGWGDIGYNYLIDSQGNIYEGRSGGDGVVAGHAYLRNRNTIGIAILGCYESADSGRKNSTCNTVNQLTPATQTALNKLIALKSQEFNIDPNGLSEFHGQILANIIGHKDVGSTTCPGDLVYNQLPQSRLLAYNLLQDLGGYQKPLANQAELVSLSAKEINIEETKSADIYVQFKNTGQSVWRGYEDNPIYIGDSSIKNKMARLDSVKIALSSDKEETSTSPINTTQNIYKLIGGNVYPGQIGRFKIALNPPADKTTETKNFTLAWQNNGYFANSDFSITVNKIACATCTTNNYQVVETYSAELNQSNFPTTLPAEKTEDVKMQFINTGNMPWEQNKLKLKLVYEKNQISPFRNDSWYSEWALIPPLEAIIYPGSTATFDFKIKAPNVTAIFPHTLSLEYNESPIYTTDQTIEVVSNYAAQITANTIPDTAKRNSRPKVSLTLKNIGSKTWDNLILKSYDIDYTNSWFKDWSWLDKKTVKKIKKTVKPGEEISFTFRIQAYWKPNTYPQIFQLYNGKTAISLDGKKELLVQTKVEK